MHLILAFLELILPLHLLLSLEATRQLIYQGLVLPSRQHLAVVDTVQRCYRRAGHSTDESHPSQLWVLID